METPRRKQRFLVTLGILTATFACGTTSATFAQPPQSGQLPPQARAIHSHFNSAAQQLARVMGTPAFRNFLSEELQQSRNKEGIIDFAQFIEKAQGRPKLGLPPGILKKIAESITGAKTKMRELRIQRDLLTVDLYFPVDSHRRIWRGQEQVQVAWQPLGPEENVKGITAYTAKDARPVTLDPNKPPDTPTLIIAARETADLRPSPPGVIVQKPSAEPKEPMPPSQQRDNTYIGVPYVLITTDLEAWYRGDPEFWVLIGQTAYGRQLQPEDRVGIGYVNGTNRWYYLGDCNGCVLYRYFNQNYSPMTYFRFMELDGGSTIPFKVSAFGVSLSFSIGSYDKEFGAVWIDKNQIPYGGYVYMDRGYIKIYVDKDY